jgi:hypothetical protein
MRQQEWNVGVVNDPDDAMAKAQQWQSTKTEIGLVLANCFFYVLVVVVAFYVVREGVTRGMLHAWAKRDRENLKAAEKAEAAAQARRAATPAAAGRTTASPGSERPGAPGTSRKA